jgi:hypothetical protein
MTMPAADREREALLEWLEAQRGHVLGVLRGLPDESLRWPDYFGDWRLRDVREIILHVITETAVHAGHLDAARELLDGRTWMGPDDIRVPRD